MDKFGTSGVVTVGMVSTSEVHEDDAGGACWMRGEIVEDGFMSVCGIVTIAVAEGNFASEEILHFRIGRGEIEDPDKVVDIGRIHASAAIEHLGDSIDFQGDTVCKMGSREVLHIEFALHAMKTDDASCRLSLPVDSTRPTCEDASNG